jgi:hypothetical protein
MAPGLKTGPRAEKCYFTPANGVLKFNFTPTRAKRYFASLTCVFYLRHSSNWNPHRLHSEPFPPKEKHNVGLLRFDDDHDHICYRFAQVRIFGEKSNDSDHYKMIDKLTSMSKIPMWG